ncbi:MAG: Unknown protein [uncultured Sulfurovum sp.]|uniref:DsrE family protein n=1 Tax=uncultured Sulfurovum sp. TaxID=269237 RepID=A0A6S6SEL4_9BACT|nr:MAG: Unknown protein [uncultured Sulfurovum sp.]
MRILILILLLNVTLLFADSKKIMIDLTTGDTKTFQSRFLSGVPNMIDYFEENNDTAKTVVVIHGDAYKFFIKNLQDSPYKDNKELHNLQDTLRKQLDVLTKKYSVSLEICSIGMKKRNIHTDVLYKFITPIHSAMTGLASWQNQGYAFLPID